MGTQWMVVGNPGDRRVAMFLSALQRAGQSKPLVLDYLTLLSTPQILEQMLRQLHPSLPLMIRIESPGGDLVIERLMLEWGAGFIKTGQRGQWITLEGVRTLEKSHGEIRYLRQSYWGFCALLDHIKGVVSKLVNQEMRSIQFLNAPDDIKCVFDKAACHDYMRQQSIAVPEALPLIQSYDELREFMETNSINRVFIKPQFGSSASGVLAYEARHHPFQEQLTTSVECVSGSNDQKFFNSLKVRKYKSSSDVRAIVDFILMNGAHIERWMPKARYGRYAYDLRVVTIAGEPTHAIARCSKSPMTNLHLGGKRVEIQDLGLSDREKSKIWDLARSVAHAFPHSFYLGLDILLTGKQRRPVLIEVNAFGDLLPGLENDLGDTYSNEVHAVIGA